MKHVSKKIILLVALSMSIINPSFASEVPFKDVELKNFLSGKSYPIGGNTLGKSKGAFYFHPNGILNILWKGKNETTTWKVEGNSKFCYTSKIFGQRECIRLVKDSGTGGYVHIYDGDKRNLAKNSIVTGKQF